MLVDGDGSNGLAFVYDEASEQDSLDRHVARSWSHGTRALGRTQWVKTLRVALRAKDADPWNAKQAKENTPQLLEVLRKHGIRAAIAMQSPATPGVRQVHSAWNMLGHNGNPYKWAGTVEQRDNIYVCPILHPFNYEYVYGWLIERWVRQAYEVACGNLAPLAWPTPHLHPSADMLAILRTWQASSTPLAVDIETNMAGTIVSAMGLSNGVHSISCPWHGYAVANNPGNRQRGLLTYPLGKELQESIVAILANSAIAKILHNGAFDVLQLAKYGVGVNGFDYDTLLLHRVAYSQYRHGLQQACATEFCVEPWKCLHRPPKVAATGDSWLANPEELRAYNAKDSFATWHLCNSLAPKVGVDF